MQMESCQHIGGISVWRLDEVTQEPPCEGSVLQL